MEKLIEIKNEIEKMNKSQQIEVYRIIKMNNIDYINLLFLTKEQQY